VHAFILSAGAINECLQQASAVAAWNDRTAIRDEHIPLDVRDAYERLYGVKWEAQLKLPAGTSKHEAKARRGEWLGERPMTDLPEKLHAALKSDIHEARRGRM
jgi:hypothetical protein